MFCLYVYIRIKVNETHLIRLQCKCLFSNLKITNMSFQCQMHRNIFLLYIIYSALIICIKKVSKNKSNEIDHLVLKPYVLPLINQSIYLSK